MIDLRNIHFHYARSGFHLDLPELKIDQGNSAALVGPSGCGKTTLLLLITGILIPETGSVGVGEAALHELGDADRRAFRIREVGFVFQNFELLDYLTLLDNILHPYRLNTALRMTAEVRSRAQELATTLGISHRLHSPVGETSRGEQQRVAVCRALITEPRILIADEPTGSLDPENKRLILDILFDYCRKSGATLIAATHDRELLDRFDQVITMPAWKQ